MLKQSTLIARLYVEGHYDDKAIYDALDIVRFAHLHINLFESYVCSQMGRQQSQRSVPETFVDPDVWRSLWDEIASALERYGIKRAWETRCMRGSWHDHRDARYELGKEILKVDQSLVKNINDAMDRIKEMGSADHPVDFPQELAANLQRI